MGSTKFSILVVAVLAGLAGLVFGISPAEANLSCVDSLPGDAGGPTITGVTREIHPTNNLIVDFEIETDAPSTVWVEYQQSVGEGSLLSTRRTADISDNHTVNVMRLVPDTQYCYQVYAESDEGLVSDSVSGSFMTGSLPQELESSSFTLVEGGPTSYPLTFLSHNAENINGIVAIDSNANVVWYVSGHTSGDIVQDPATYNLIFASGSVVKEVTPAGELVRQSPRVCDIPLDDPEARGIQDGVHHELLEPDGDIIRYLGTVIRDPFDDPDRLQRGDTIREWNRVTDADRQVWETFDFLDPANDRTSESDNTSNNALGCDGETVNQDWTHANALQIVPEGNARPDEDGNFIMSMRHLDQIISIESDFSGVAWRLGDATQLGTPTSDFSFPDPNDKFYRQHSARQLPNGNILLFDNGTFRPEEEGGEYSRGLELELDMEDMTATKVWEYRHSPDLFARIVSNVTRLPNGNTVVVFGSAPGEVCCRTFTLVEADNEPQANALSVIEISAPGKSVQYRAHPSFTVNGEFEVANRPPTSPADSDGSPNQAAEDSANGDPVGITASSIDPDGDAVTFSLIDVAEGRFDIDAETGVVTVADSEQLTGLEEHTITVQASDDGEGTSTADFDILVAPSGECGDMNGDSQVNIRDVVIALRISIGLLDPTALQQFFGDIDHNGLIEREDVQAILMSVVGRTEGIQECG